MKSVSSGTNIKKTSLPRSSGMSSIRSGTKIIKGQGAGRQEATRAISKERLNNRKKLRENHLKEFKNEDEFNKWADYLYNYKSYTGEELAFPAPIQSQGVGGEVVKGGSRAVNRLLPRLFRGALNYDGPIFITPNTLREGYRNRAYPQSFRDLTPAQIQQYTFGRPHNNPDEVKEGQGTLADYIQAGGDLSNPEVAPFLDLYQAEASRTASQSLEDAISQFTFNDAINTPLPPDDDFPELDLTPPTYPNQPEVKIDMRNRSRLWTDMWKNNKNKPKGGSAKNGKWKKEMDATLEGEDIPDVDSPEYPAFLEKMRNKFYKTPRGSTVAPISALPPAGQPPAQPPAGQGGAEAPVAQQPAQQPAQPAQPINNAPVNGGSNMPPLRFQPNQPPPQTRGGGGGDPYIPRGTRGLIPTEPIPRFGTRRIPPIPPVWWRDGKPHDEPPRRRPPKDDKPPPEEDEGDEGDEGDGGDEETKETDHKNQTGSGYGYIRPEFSTDTGAESLILSGKDQITALNRWDKFDDPTSAIYTMDNPLYVKQVKQDSFRFSGIAKDPYLYLAKAYERHYAPDEFKIYPTQGSRFDANNKMTALGQVWHDAYDIAGSRERGLAVRRSPDYEVDLIERMYENPDLEEQIQYKATGQYLMKDMDDLAEAVRKTEKITLMNRWTTETSDFIESNNTKVNFETLRMEMRE